ncbi:MAG: hypothetical protein M1828_000206 [Chrysothrix sp. TS-e1954]|nr:MAG: hypothetical protein M1828_000206 [Chrysothrix sp. TS-e1954]
MDGASEDVDLYEILGVSRSSSKAEIKKAYHKAALSSHPDKFPDDERPEAEVKFKAVSQAYDILKEDDSRHLYDTHGMAAFEKGSGGGAGGAEMDMEDILNMFGMGGGMPGMGGMGGVPRRPRRGEDDVNEQELTLEELYKGKAIKFNNTKNVVCSHCKGSGGKEKVQPKKCGTCDGKGLVQRLVQVGPGLVSPTTANCTTCHGNGKFFKDKDRCKRCKGARVVSQKKPLELYIPPGSREGERIVLAGEADQHPDQEPGDIIFQIKEKPHAVFSRIGADLSATIDVTLAEALTGFDRIVVKHLDGRGISLRHPQATGAILRPGQVLRLSGEGMPVKRSDSRGGLYLQVDIKFPEDGYFNSGGKSQKIQELLPKPNAPMKADEVDDVEYEPDADIDDFGAGSDDPRGGAEWEDEDEAGETAQCQQQ